MICREDEKGQHRNNWLNDSEGNSQPHPDNGQKTPGGSSRGLIKDSSIPPEKVRKEHEFNYFSP
jgi:hypothetical protein